MTSHSLRDLYPLNDEQCMNGDLMRFSKRRVISLHHPETTEVALQAPDRSRRLQNAMQINNTRKLQSGTIKCQKGANFSLELS